MSGGTGAKGSIPSPALIFQGNRATTARNIELALQLTKSEFNQLIGKHSENRKTAKRRTGIRRDGIDRIFSDFIRYRDKWICQGCGKGYPERAQGLHCSHFFSRRYKGTRWLPMNADAHCYYCHSKFGGDPALFYEWKLARIGQKQMDHLRSLAYGVTKFSPVDLKLLQATLNKNLAELRRAYGKAEI